MLALWAAIARVHIIPRGPFVSAIKTGQPFNIVFQTIRHLDSPVSRVGF